MKLYEVATPLEKAGIIPYLRKSSGIEFYFMIPSDVKFGGPQPGIAKGRVDKGESVEDTAWRETKEELGLRRSNCVDGTFRLAWKGKVQGNKEVYTMAVYVVEVDKRHKFRDPDHEVAKRVWMTAKDFAKKGRASQVKIVNAAQKLLSGGR